MKKEKKAIYWRYSKKYIDRERMANNSGGRGRDLNSSVGDQIIQGF